MTCFLVLEDDEALGRAYRRLLRVHGDVRVVASVAEAREALAAFRPVGVLADVSLPDGDGLAFAREARDVMVDLPILIVSGAVGHDRLARAHEMDAAFLLKPAGREQIARFAEHAIAAKTRRVENGKTSAASHAGRRNDDRRRREDARRSLALCLQLPWDDPVRIEAVKMFRAVLAMPNDGRGGG